MAKYHVSDSGKVVVCKAKKNNCPKENFNNINDAEIHKEKMFNKGLLSISKTAKTPLRAAEKYYGGKFISEHSIPLEKGVESVLEDLKEIGNPLIVGGAVRDSFVGSENKDIDIEVHGTDIDSLVKTLKNKNYIVDEVGKQFGVLKVSKKGTVSDLDISVPRKENRLGAGHRSFNVEMDENMTVQEAAERRDFTFNAVMYDHSRKVIIDPSNGKEDLKNKVIKHVSEKFAEDPLRVLRGFQFAGRFGMTVDPKTASLCKNLRKEYDDLSIERVQEEWGKFFTKSAHPEKGVQSLKDMGWDDTISGLQQSLNNPNTIDSLKNLPNVSKENKIVFGSASIAKNMDDKDRKDFISSTVIGNKEQLKAYDLSNFDNSKATTSYDRKIVAKNLEKNGFTFKDYQNFSQMNNDNTGMRLSSSAIKEGLANGSEKDLVMGKDVTMISDKKPGKWIGELLNRTRDLQYQGKFNNKNEALEFIKAEIDKQNN